VETGIITGTGISMGKGISTGTGISMGMGISVGMRISVGMGTSAEVEWESIHKGNRSWCGSEIAVNIQEEWE